MPNTHTTLTSLFSDIADAIRGKTGSSATIVADDFPTAIANIPTGGGSAAIEPLSVTANGTYTAPSGVDGYSPITVNVPKNGVTTTEEPNSTGTTLYINSTGGDGGGGSTTDPVRFIDYDGTILYSYSAADFASLMAMPTNPTHAGLTSQGWNWTLADAKSYVAGYGTLDIGQMYITDDEKTRVYISLVDSARLSPYLGIYLNGTVVVDWGDNTATDTLTGTSLATVQRVQHTYASTGNYVITLEVTSGSFRIYGSNASSNGSYLLTSTNTDAVSQRCYLNAIQKVELGLNVSLGDYAFYNCFSLASITIPSGVTSIGGDAFDRCYSLASITIPSSITSIDSSVFYACYSLASITIPSGITSISGSMFYYCYSLASVTIPSSVTSIIGSVFYSCYSLTSVTIPSSVTSIGSSVFNNCQSLASITIPSEVISIGSNMFNSCYSLASITIPSGVTSISSYAFNSCYGIAEYHFLPATPPTLANTNAFMGIQPDCKIYVPAASLTAYQEATNWSTYASYMVGE